MIELPVVHLSDNRTKRNCAEDQITSSSAKRLRCMAQMLLAARNSRAKSRSDTLSRLLAVGLSKPSALAVICRSMGKTGAGEGGGTQRAFVHAGACIGKPLRSRANIST